MAESASVIAMPPRSDYGAVEVKQFINKATIRGFVITLAIFTVLILLYIIFVKIAESASEVRRAPIAKIRLENLPPPAETDELAPPPPTQQLLNTGPAARAGTPVAVPDAQITADLKDFADVNELARASAEGGDGTDIGGFSSNINIDERPDVNVEHREEEPGIYDFVPVEKEPWIDLEDLQKRVTYPEMARRAGIEGKVIIRVLVGKDGKPSKVVIESSENELLNDAAKSAVLKSVFTPGIQNDRPITCWVSIPIVFRLR